MKKRVLLFTLFICFFTCDDIIEVVDISNKIVNILAPANNSVIDTTVVTFTWQSVEDAEQYHLQVATPTFENASQILVDTLVASVNYTKTLEASDYQWRIRAENSDYETNYTTADFIVEE